MSFDYSKLRGRIVEKFGSQAAFAKALEISDRTLSLKLTNKFFFSQDEIVKAMRLLGLDIKKANEYFFTKKV